MSGRLLWVLLLAIPIYAGAQAGRGAGGAQQGRGGARGGQTAPRGGNPGAAAPERGRGRGREADAAPPDRPSAVRGTGSISGVVMRADTNETLSRARIDLIRADSTRARVNENLPQNTVTTDEHGSFTFTGVAGGRYILSAARNQFVRMDFGRRGRNELGTALVVEPGENIDNVVLRMFVAPTISGVVSDASGQPLVAATVAAYHLEYGPSGRTLALAKATVTNDHGEYRLFWLAPGDYYLVAGHGIHSFNPLLDGVELTPNLPAEDRTFAVVYYPSATNVGDAETVRLAAGLDTFRDIRFKEAPRRRINGYVVDAATNKPIANASVLLLAGSGHTGGQDPDPIKTNENGYFSVPDAAAGVYLLSAFADPMPQPIASRNLQSGAQERAVLGPRLFSELRRVDVSAENVEGLVLPVVAGARIDGCVQFEGILAGRGGPIEGAQSLREVLGAVVNLLRRDGGVVEPRSQGLSSSGAFSIDEVPPGHYDVSVPVPAGYYVKTLQYSGLDALTAGLVIRAQNTRVAAVEAKRDETAGSKCAQTERAGALDIVLGVGGTASGRILDRGNAVAGAQVILVPDPNSDTPRAADRYKIAASDVSGSYSIRGVPPGRYLAFAFEEIEARFYYDSEFLVRFGNRGAVVQMQDNGIVQPELQIIPASETEAWYR